MFGLPDQTIKLLRNYFAGRSDIIEVKIYGSRAMGTEKPGSDIDLALFTNAESDISGAVKTDLDDLPTPYLFDVTDYNRISHQPLKEHIDRVGKTFYNSSSN